MVASNLVEQPAPKRKAGDRGPEISVLAEIQARNLYLNECLTYAVISEKTGIPKKTLERWAHKKGWVGMRRKRREDLIKSSDVRANSMAEQVIDAIASASEQHAIRGLQRVGEALERTDRDAAKDFQALTAGVKNLATTARAMREPIGSMQSDVVNTTNLFFLSAMPAQVQVEAKQVTEVEVSKAQEGSKISQIVS